MVVRLAATTPVFDDAQETWPVRFWVELSVYVPVAVNCSVSPLGTFGFAGVTAIVTSAAGATVSVVLPTMLPSVAETVVLPATSVVARPAELLEFEIVAILVSADAQAT